MIISRPAREVGPFDWFEPAACEFERSFGRCGGGRKTYQRPDEACDHATPKGLPECAISLHARKCIADKDSSSARANGVSGEPTQLWRAGAPMTGWGSAHGSDAFARNPIVVCRDRHQFWRKFQDPDHHDIQDDPHGRPPDNLCGAWDG